MKCKEKHKGIVVIICIIFLSIMSALTVMMMEMSVTNVRVADNQHQVNGALVSAQSGLEIIRYWLSEISVPGTVAPADRLASVSADLQSALALANITNIDINYDSLTNLLSINTVNFDSQPVNLSVP